MKIHVSDVPDQRCLIRCEEGIKRQPVNIPLAVEGNLWKVFLHCATIAQMVVLAALMAVYEEWRQMGPITVTMTIFYAALSLVGLALLKTFRGHYYKAHAALLHLPLLGAETLFIAVGTAIHLNNIVCDPPEAYHEGRELHCAHNTDIELLLNVFSLFGLFYFYALFRAMRATENGIIFESRTPTVTDKRCGCFIVCFALAVGAIIVWTLVVDEYTESGISEELAYAIIGAVLLCGSVLCLENVRPRKLFLRRLKAVYPVLLSAYLLILAAYAYRRSVPGGGALFASMAIASLGMLDVFGAYKQLALCVATTPLMLVGCATHVTPSMSYSIYLRCLERYTETEADYCVDVYFKSYYAMNASGVACFTWAAWRVYTATKRATTAVKEHLL